MEIPRRRPGRPRRADQRDTRELILRTATARFARHGFDAVSVRQIAESAGVDVATVHHHTGGKAELYEACIARVFEAESAAMIPLIAAARSELAEGPSGEGPSGEEPSGEEPSGEEPSGEGPSGEGSSGDGSGGGGVLAGLHRVLDAFIDFLETHPETTGLWLRRWLEPKRHAGWDERYAAPLYQQVEQLLAAAHVAGVLHEPTPRVAVRSLVWAVHAHAVVALTGELGPGARQELRDFGHRWLQRMYARP